MKERPLLFSPPMAVAVDERRKTQTRRIIKGIGFVGGRGTQDDPESWGFEDKYGDFYTLAVHANSSRDFKIQCPYGKIGDHLWVRENWCTLYEYNNLPPRDIPKTAPIEYESTDKPMLYGKTRPNIFMCRWMSRFLLEITDIRVQRVQDISNEDAKAEGVHPPAPHRCGKSGYGDCYPCAFMRIWNQINQTRETCWDFNPWVWAINFKRIDNG